jgi:predicted nucleotidyltransferase
MPVKSLSSSVLKWPDSDIVIESFLKWAKKAVQNRKDVVKIGYFGSYARGNWGVGSDLDIIVVIKSSNLSFYERPIEWDTMDIPVPVDLLIYTLAEFDNMKLKNGGFFKTLENEVKWFQIQI